LSVDAQKAKMNEKLKTGFAERLKTAAAARQALLAQLRPRPTSIDPQHGERQHRRDAELQGVREERTAVKAAKRQAAVEAEIEVLRAKSASEQATLEARRGVRKERKALSTAEAKLKRDAKYAARKARH
jgi:hypothetical protein